MVQVERKLSSLHRSRIDIIATILRAAENGARKTHIMYACNLSFRQLRLYLDLLLDRGLLKVVPSGKADRGDRNAYKTTGKGMAFIRTYRNIRIILSS